MNPSEKGREIHARAEQAREKGEFLEALKFTDEAMAAYVEDGDILGFTEVLQSRALTARHLADKTGSDLWLRYALHVAMAGVEAAEKSGDKSAVIIPYHTVGKTYESLEEYDEAVKWHQKAVDHVGQLPSLHNREGFKAEMMGHLYFCQMMTGDAGAYEKLGVAIEMLKKSDESKYNKEVWLSGMYMSAAQGLVSLGRKEEASEQMNKAKQIIDSNPDLTLRKQQWERLEKELR